MQENDITIVIPLFKAKVYLNRLEELLNKEIKLKAFKFILVNDGGDKETGEILETLATTHENLDYLNLADNVGQHAATALGVKKATTSFVVTLDQDYILQLPEFLKYFTAQPEKGELIYLALQKMKRNALRSLASNILLNIMNWFGGFSLPGIYSSRIFHQTDVKDLAIHSKFILDLELLKSGLQARVLQTEIVLFEKESSYSFLLLFRNFNHIILYYTFFYELVAISIAGVSLPLFSWRISVLFFCLLVVVLLLKGKMKNLMKK